MQNEFLPRPVWLMSPDLGNEFVFISKPFKHGLESWLMKRTKPIIRARQKKLDILFYTELDWFVSEWSGPCSKQRSVIKHQRSWVSEVLSVGNRYAVRLLITFKHELQRTKYKRYNSNLFVGSSGLKIDVYDLRMFFLNGMLVVVDPLGTELPMAEVVGVPLTEALQVVRQENQTSLDNQQAAFGTLEIKLKNIYIMQVYVKFSNSKCNITI